MPIGRFAPSPTGPLHFGSLVAAVASYCDAKAQHGLWLLRIEDIDTPRQVAGASQHIIRTLAEYGFEWDADILYQSQRSEMYQHYLELLIDKKLVYPCGCSRKEIADSSTLFGIEGVIYPGTCRNRYSLTATAKASAWRIRVPDRMISFNDRWQGQVQHQLERDIGDFVLKRADGQFAYQLAVVVDDALSGVTDVVRGADLLNSTTRQLYLQQCLAFDTPRYLHIPLVTNAQGEKLSKQTLAKEIEREHAAQNLVSALCFLNQHPPDNLSKASVATIWQWAFEHWHT